MSDDALLATMDELSGCLRLRDEHKANIAAAQVALGKLEDEIARLREELAGHLREYGLEPARPDLDWTIAERSRFQSPEPPTVRPLKKIGRPVGSVDKRPRRRPDASKKITSQPALEALETIRASGPEGANPKELHLKPWVAGLLARMRVVRKLPNGNWIAA